MPSFRVLAGLGYAILAPNVRGSSGYGDEVLRGLMGEVGDGELIDMMAGLDYAIANRDIDPERLGVRGWSWGGVASSYTITQTDPLQGRLGRRDGGQLGRRNRPGLQLRRLALVHRRRTPWDQP